MDLLQALLVRFMLPKSLYQCLSTSHHDRHTLCRLTCIYGPSSIFFQILRASELVKDREGVEGRSEEVLPKYCTAYGENLT